MTCTCLYAARRERAIVCKQRESQLIYYRLEVYMPSRLRYSRYLIVVNIEIERKLRKVGKYSFFEVFSLYKWKDNFSAKLHYLCLLCSIRTKTFGTEEV